VKRDYSKTWNLIEEINKKKMVKQPEKMNKEMLYKKVHIEKNGSQEEIKLPVPTLDDLKYAAETNKIYKTKESSLEKSKPTTNTSMSILNNSLQNLPLFT
jgi:hypothetical protein